MVSAISPARREREELCDLFVDVGPDAPTLCGDWTTRDLAAHLVMRERRPDGAIGIVIPGASGYGAKVQDKIAETDWPELVERVRSGPPRWSPTAIPAVDKLVNSVEFFVHHEDVRRAADGWAPREAYPELAAALVAMLGRFARRMVRSSTVGIVLEPIEDEYGPVVAKELDPSVTVRGNVGELVLFAFGRQHHTVVEMFGDDDSVASAMAGRFGL